jgi:hypothetical protein
MTKRTIISPEAACAFPALFEPKPHLSGVEKFGCTLIFDEDADLSELEDALREAARERLGDKAEALIKSKALKWPIRDGAEKAHLSGFGAGKRFVNAASTRQHRRRRSVRGRRRQACRDN